MTLKPLPTVCTAAAAFLVVHLLLPLGLVASCVPTTVERVITEPQSRPVWRDPDTGCHYWMDTGLARHDQDGMPYCTDIHGRRTGVNGRLGVRPPEPRRIRKAD